MVTRTAKGTYKANLDVGIGNLQAIPFVFDTGSTGLHVFADVNFDGPESGIQCTQTPTRVVYGNPPRVIFRGVICNATLHLGTTATPGPVPIAYLTEAECPPTARPGCRPPDVHSVKAMGGYGIFGAGLAGIISGKGIAPPPLLSLPGRYGRIYSIVLSPYGGELILGSHVPRGAAVFDLIKTEGVPGAEWALGRACLFVNGQPIGTCLFISFDTGNGVPWLHNVANPLLHLSRRGLVLAGTRVGFAPVPASQEATSVIAGREFWNRIRNVPSPQGKIMTNTSIQVFFGHFVTYDAVNGAISFAPAISPAPPGNTNLPQL
jgi:hypothetical protein